MKILGWVFRTWPHLHRSLDAAHHERDNRRASDVRGSPTSRDALTSMPSISIHLTRRRAIPYDHPDAYRLRDIRGYDTVRFLGIATIGPAIDLMSGLEARGPLRMCRPALSG
jgi:hypothetical protein